MTKYLSFYTNEQLAIENIVYVVTSSRSVAVLLLLLGMDRISYLTKARRIPRLAESETEIYRHRDKETANSQRQRHRQRARETKI